MPSIDLLPIIKLLLPEVLVIYFDIVNHSSQEEELHLYFQERNELPNEYKKGEATSKGFYKEITIQDFPIRGKQVYLHVKRRRWQDNWDLVAKGTRMTKEFATFLKQLHQ
jgi:hypothetical protein